MLACCRSPPARVLSASVSHTLTVLRLSNPFEGARLHPRLACFAERSAVTHAAVDPDGRRATRPASGADCVIFDALSSAVVGATVPDALTAPSCSYRTLAAPHNVTVEVKKSKFITSAWPTNTTEEVCVISGQ